MSARRYDLPILMDRDADGIYVIADKAGNVQYLRHDRPEDRNCRNCRHAAQEPNGPPCVQCNWKAVPPTGWEPPLSPEDDPLSAN